MSERIDIAALRARLGWTQDELADYLGLDRSYVSKLEGGAEPSRPVKRLLAILESTTPRPKPVEVRAVP